MVVSVVAVGLMATLGACFDGAQALGLPCEEDADCGRSQSCEQGFCGGPAGTSTLTPTTSTSSDDTATSATTNDASDSGSSDTASSSDGGARCGDGIEDPGEDCDPGPQDSAECDNDCTTPECGDNYVNVAAGETCDPPGGTTCTAQCQQVLFFDDMSDLAASRMNWQTLLPELKGTQLTPAAVWDTDPDLELWRSGRYSCASGVSDLVTNPFQFGDVPEGMHAQLSFRHRHEFDPEAGVTKCDGYVIGDGGVVEVVVDGVAQSINNLPGALSLADSNCSATGDPDNPMIGTDAFVRGSGNDGALVNVVASLEAWEFMPGDVQIRFRVAHDCGNCGYVCLDEKSEIPPGYGWQIDDVRIEYVAD